MKPETAIIHIRKTREAANGFVRNLDGLERMASIGLGVMFDVDSAERPVLSLHTEQAVLQGVTFVGKRFSELTTELRELLEAITEE